MAAETSAELRFFFVWQPVLPSDVVDRAGERLRAETDVRARHYWDDELRLGRAWGTPLQTPYVGDEYGGPLAWDVVMVFDRLVRWGPTFPAPALHMFPRDTAAGAPAFSVERLRGAIARG
jgi:hypothetical protein